MSHSLSTSLDTIGITPFLKSSIECCKNMLSYNALCLLTGSIECCANMLTSVDSYRIWVLGGFIYVWSGDIQMDHNQLILFIKYFDSKNNKQDEKSLQQNVLDAALFFKTLRLN